MSGVPAGNCDVRERLGRVRVAVLGCGGLGSNVAMMLVRAGVRRLVLVDHDLVEASNLDRQLFFLDQVGRRKTEALADTLRRIEPGLDLAIETVRMRHGNVAALCAGCDAVAEAVDSAEGKVMVLDALAEGLPGVPVVTVSGLAGCATASAIATERLSDDVWVVGDLASDVRDGLPLVSSRVMVAAAHQAHAIVRLALGLEP